jgi:hypothetical protein
MQFINFMASQAGRSARIVIGALLIVVAMAAWHGLLEAAAVVLGGVLIAVGVFDICLLAPLFGKPLSGRKIRG